jgi:hypothetical protein
MASQSPHFDARLCERVRRMQGRCDALCQHIDAGFADGVEASGLAGIEAAIALERKPAQVSARGI